VSRHFGGLSGCCFMQEESLSIADVAENPQPAGPRRRAVKSVPTKPRSQPAPAGAPAGQNSAAPSLSGDMLRGVAAIAEFIYGESNDQLRHQIYRLASTKVSAGRRIPTFHMGDAVICARKSTILAWIARQEAEAVADDQPIAAE
jgi:hypothetical protein